MSRIGRPIREVTYTPVEEPVPRPVRLPDRPQEDEPPVRPAGPGRPVREPERTPVP